MNLARIDVGLTSEAPLLPMRPMAHIKRDWSISSEPWEWRLRLNSGA